jgi:hypothetical protein
MAVLMTNDNKELVVTCKCGCENAVHIRIDHEDWDDYALCSYLNSNWYRDQDDRVLRVIGRKLKKIWAIIRNKDYHYSEIVMTKADFEVFKEYVNSVE